MGDSSAALKPGDIVLTTYGVAVITQVPASPKTTTSDNEKQPEKVSDVVLFGARLWRHPGKSIASTSYACLNTNCVIRSLPAAPGMVTTVRSSASSAHESLKEGDKVSIVSYSQFTNSYLARRVLKEKNVSTTAMDQSEETKPSDVVNGEKSTESVDDGEEELFALTPDQIYPAKSAKFYPLMADLMVRGDRAATTATSIVASGSSTLLKSDILSGKTNAAAEATTPTDANSETQAADTSTTTATVVEDSSRKVASATRALQSAIPDAKQASQVVSMLRDEELTKLLEKGRERLRQLMTLDIPKATETALSELGIDFAPSTSTSSSSSLILSREKALKAMDDILSKANADVTMESITSMVTDQFSTMFDSLSTAAQSDGQLGQIFQTISDRTSEWQEATGRVLSTRSASLFFEGTQRLQARAANLFSPDQIAWARECSARMTKGFTEGDAALARLKTVQLGEAVRSRLFEAIEVRSGSQGGLDGIIAGALTSLSSSDLGDAAAGTVQMKMAQLQSSASSAAKSAHETLIATLARRSQYQDQALSKIEEALVGLETHLGEDMTADEIASLARGEGGTAALFDPIAKRAAKEIDKQLDVAEKNVSDPTVLAVLTNVRKIISGELTVSALTDEVVKVLNEDQSVQTGERLVMHGERILDVLENASKNKYVGDVLGVVENAGLTKDAVVQQLENLDMNTIVGTAESAVTDENVRKQILSSAADSALDFLLRILPSMPVPPLDGVKDGLVYHLSNLSMEGFKVRKEDILVDIAGVRAVNRPDAEGGEGGNKEGKEDEQVQVLKTEEEAVSFLQGGDGDEGQGEDEALLDAEGGEKKTVKATELLVIDVRNISAVLDDAVWSFEQTYFPYLKGSGKAFVQLSEGSIRLQFELRKKRNLNYQPGEDNTEREWDPVLCLHEHDCCISEIDLRLKGEGRIVWILNKIATMLKGPLRGYVVKQVQRTLGNGSGMLLEKLNETLGNYWDMVLKMAGLNLDELPEVTVHDVMKAEADPHANEVELVWRERLPLGMNLLMNDDSGVIKVVEFPRGSQARSVAEQSRWDPTVFNGATITAVNGVRYDEDSQDDLLEALKDPGRPKAITFLLSDAGEAERIQKFCSSMQEGEDGETDMDKGASSSVGAKTKNYAVESVILTEEGPLGIKFSNSLDDYSLAVEGFSKGENGETLPAETCGRISVGDVLVSINGDVVVGAKGAGRRHALELFEKVGGERPLTLGLSPPFLRSRVFSKEPSVGGSSSDVGGGPHRELKFREMKDVKSGRRRVVLDKYESVAGKVESANVFIGDHLIELNGTPVGLSGTDPRLDDGREIQRIIQEQKESYPLTLTFARPSNTGSRWQQQGANIVNLEQAQKFTVTVNNPGELGFRFTKLEGSKGIVVKSFYAVKGPIQQQLQSDLGGSGQWIGMAVETVNGQAVPSYATADMVSSALQSSWTRNGKVEIVFCEDNMKDWLESLGKE